MAFTSNSSKPMGGETFVRLQASYRGRLGAEVGIFVAVDHLRRADGLTEDEEELYFDSDDWFEIHLPNPRLEPLCRMLDKYGVAWATAESADPDTIIYEDPFQVGAVPYQRLLLTPLPRDVVLGPTTAGSKRHLGKRARRWRLAGMARAVQRSWPRGLVSSGSGHSLRYCRVMSRVELDDSADATSGRFGQTWGAGQAVEFGLSSPNGAAGPDNA